MKQVGYLLLALLTTSQVIAQSMNQAEIGFLEIREARNQSRLEAVNDAIKTTPAIKSVSSARPSTFGQGQFHSEHFNFNIYPNPNVGETLYLENKEFTAFELEVIDMRGQIIIRDKIQPGAGGNYDLVNWEQGMYLFNFKNESGSGFTRKVAVFY